MFVPPVELPLRPNVAGEALPEVAVEIVQGFRTSISTHDPRCALPLDQPPLVDAAQYLVAAAALDRSLTQGSDSNAERLQAVFLALTATMTRYLSQHQKPKNESD